MKNALRYLVTACLAGVVSFGTSSGCNGDDGEVPPQEKCAAAPYECTTCESNEWCGGKADRFKWICTTEKRCKRLCTKAADCRADLKEVCEDAVCRPPACGHDGQCNNGEACIAGACKPPIAATAVTACEVLPKRALLHQGATKTFSVLAKDGGGKTLAYKGTVEWSADPAGRATVANGVATGGAEAGAVSIKAKVGSVECTASAATNFLTVSGNTTRVVVADLLSHELLANASVVIGSETKVTDANGAVEFTGVDNKPTISVFHATHAYVTMVDVNTKDVVVFLKPPTSAAKFSGEMTARSFDNLSDLKGNIHLSINGSSIPGNLIDIQLSTLLGDSVPTTLELSPTQKFDLSLPDGIVIGLGEQMFKSKFNVQSTPGTRTVWGIGGNAEFGAISTALAPVIGGNTDDIQVGPILASILPLLNKLQSGVVTGQTAVAGQTKDVDLKLEQLLRLKLTAQLPDLPKYKVGTEEFAFEGGIVLGGALHGTQGLVPLGLSAGVDLKGATGTDGKPIGDGKIDPLEEGAAAGALPLRVAPLHGGLESAKYVSLALAASFSGLVGGDEEPTADRKPLVLAGLIAFPGDIDYSATTPKSVSFGTSFLGVPENPSLADRAFNQGSKVDGAVFHRLDIGGEETGEWFVYFPAGSDVKTFNIPTPPSGFDDRYTKTETGKKELPRAILQSIRIGGASLTYDKVLEFDADNMDDLSSRIDAFSTREIVRPDLP